LERLIKHCFLIKSLETFEKWRAVRDKREKLEEKIKELNEIRAMYHRRFKDIEKR